MGYDITVSVDVQCDRCQHCDYMDFDEDTTTDEIEKNLEAEGWQFIGGDLLCPDCVERYGPENVFLNNCRRCTRHINVRKGLEIVLYCPHFKRDCSEVFDPEDSSECSSYLPIGGIRSERPQYKPTSASLNGFVEGLNGGR